MTPTNDFSHLWNDLPDEERERLFPHMLEHQILILWQSKVRAIKAHNKHMADTNELMNNLERELSKYR